MVCGRVNYTNLSRYSSLSERTFRRNLNKGIGFESVNGHLIKTYGSRVGVLLLVVDATFHEKSGRHTPNLDRLYNGKSDRHISVWGDGSPTREFIYSDDAARGIVMGALSYNEADPVNLGTNREITIKNLITLICQLMEYDGELVWETDKPNGQPRRCLDTTRAKERFAFEAQISFEEGLRRTIDWYRANAV